MLYFKQIFMGALLLTAVCQSGQASHSDSDSDNYRHGRRSHHGYSHKHSDVFQRLEKELDRHEGRRHDRHDHSHHSRHHHRHDSKSVIVPHGHDYEKERDHHKVREVRERFEHRGIMDDLKSLARHTTSDLKSLAIYTIKAVPFAVGACYLLQWGLNGVSRQLSHVTGRR